MGVLEILADDEYYVRMYSMAELEIELLRKKKGRAPHVFHPEIERKIKQIGVFMRRTENAGEFDVSAFLEGVFQERLVGYGEELFRKDVERFDKRLEEKFFKIDKNRFAEEPKKEKKLKRDVSDQMVRDGKPACADEKSALGSQMLRDTYGYLSECKDSVQFLEEVHRGVLERHCAESASRTKGAHQPISAAQQWVRDKYHRGGPYRLEMYNDRFVFAELYHYIRGGMHEEAAEFVKENSEFFTQVCRNFSESVLLWMQSVGMIKRTLEKKHGWEETPREGDDPFKLFFFQVFNAERHPSKEVITTIEDFVWYHLLINRTIRASFPKKKTVDGEELFRMLLRSVSVQRLLQAAVLLGQWTAAIDILYDDRLRVGEALVLANAVAKRVKEERREEFPIERREEKKQSAECICFFVKMVQHAASLFARPEEKLTVIRSVSPYISKEWMEDLVAEVFIDTEEFGVLGKIDAEGRKTKDTLKNYVDAELGAVVAKVSEYYVHIGELENALRVSYLGSTERTLEILKRILIEKIKKREFGKSGLEPIVKHFNSGVVNILWSVVRLGGEKGSEKGNLTNLIKSTGLVPQNDTSSVIRKAEEISRLSSEIRSVVPFALAVIAERLGENNTPEHKEMAKGLIQLAGMIGVERTTVQEILSHVSSHV